MHTNEHSNEYGRGIILRGYSLEEIENVKTEEWMNKTNNQYKTNHIKNMLKKLYAT